MLKEIQIKNFAIIDDVNVTLKKGLNILSGETGAGKTLVIEAINMLMGDRADSELIREDADKLYVQGYFDLSKSRKSIQFLTDESLAYEDDDFTEVVITREVNRQGKNRAYINGIFTQIKTLKELGKCFLDLHGQHEHQYLLDPSTHIEIIDSFNIEFIAPLKENYKKAYETCNKIFKKLEDLKKLKNEKDTKLADLKFRLSEIEGLKLKEGEEFDLENEKNIMKNHEKIFNICKNSLEILNSEDSSTKSFTDNYAILLKNIKDLSTIDKNCEKFDVAMSSFGNVLLEIKDFLINHIENIDFSAGRLDGIQERLFKISEIKRKYNMDIEQILEYAVEIKNGISGFENLDEEIAIINDEYNLQKEALRECSLKLSEERQKNVKTFKEKIISELKQLNFKSPAFDVKNEHIPGNGSERDIEIGNKSIRPGPDGIDSIEFFISLNPGEAIKPLRKVASGGEISRIMLALKSITSGIDDIISMVFDEIDTGIGGSTAIIVGKKLYNISKKCQVICITHLPQIASFADNNYFIDKKTDGQRTKIRIMELDDKNRIMEISRMLSGMADSDISIKHADELLKKTSEIKKETMEVF